MPLLDALTIWPAQTLYNIGFTLCALESDVSFQHGFETNYQKVNNAAFINETKSIDGFQIVEYWQTDSS